MGKLNDIHSYKEEHYLVDDDDDVPPPLFSDDDAGADADAELSDAAADVDISDDDSEQKLAHADAEISPAGFTSMPGTPKRPRRRSKEKNYASETEAAARRRRSIEQEWASRRSRAAEGLNLCRVFVRKPSGCMEMDVEEVKACRDLGIGLPDDWTIEMPGWLSAANTSSGGNSPLIVSSSSTASGTDSRKVSLKAWAQAVAAATASRYGG